MCIFCLFEDPAPTEIYTLSLHDALPISITDPVAERVRKLGGTTLRSIGQIGRSQRVLDNDAEDRKSTRLNSSHVEISYAVFCLKKKKQNSHSTRHHLRPIPRSHRTRPHS